MNTNSKLLKHRITVIVVQVAEKLTNVLKGDNSSLEVRRPIPENFLTWQVSVYCKNGDERNLSH